MGEILIGTSGYHYADWVGLFYPEGTKSTESLAYYSTQFPFVELNYTYYRPPVPKQVERIVQKTPEDFRFAVKMHQGLTHERSGNLIDQVDVFRKGVTPLVQAPRLGVILLQFPYSFHYTQESRYYLHDLCEALEGLPLAVEFRGAEWQRESVYEELKKLGAALVNVDLPYDENKFSKNPRPTSILIAPFGYIRFHGRNFRNWWTGDSTDRYDYLYRQDELAPWVDWIHKMDEQADTLYIAFNNHANAQAVSNARDLQFMLFGKSVGG